jgi:LPXTG-motif cell wall-anchored protein
MCVCCSVFSSAATGRPVPKSHYMFFLRIFFFTFLFLRPAVYAQTKPTIKASVNKNKIFLGQPFELTIESVLPSGTVARPLKIDTIPHFEFLEAPVIDTIKEGSGLTIKGVYKLTSFDSGHWVIPSFYISSRIRSDTLPIDVIFSEFDPNQAYHDIKDIIEVEKPKEKNWLWLYIAVGALLMATAIYFLTRKKKKPVLAKSVTSTTPYEEAIRNLEKLRKSGLPSKEFYSELISIFRVYVFKKKGILSLQKTTDDLVGQLKELGLTHEVFDPLSTSLRLSDFVKFAKYVPGADDDNAAYNAIKNGIEAIEKL